MRKVVAYELMSLDGVAENPDAFITTWDEQMDANLADVIATQDAVILGHRSYDEWAAFWPTSEIQPFSSFINAVPKYVATSTPLSPAWAHSSAIAGDLTDFVRGLQQGPGGDIGVHASIEVTRALLSAGAVDELRLVVAPVVCGRGRHLLADLPELRLELVRSTGTTSGHLLADYRVVTHRS